MSLWEPEDTVSRAGAVCLWSADWLMAEGCWSLTPIVGVGPLHLSWTTHSQLGFPKEGAFLQQVDLGVTWCFRFLPREGLVRTASWVVGSESAFQRDRSSIPHSSLVEREAQQGPPARAAFSPGTRLGLSTSI